MEVKFQLEGLAETLFKTIPEGAVTVADKATNDASAIAKALLIDWIKKHAQV